MTSPRTHGVLVDISNLLNGEVEEKLNQMFGSLQGKRVYRTGWERYRKRNENHTSLPLPSVEIEGWLNYALLHKLDEIENSLKGFQKLASAQHVLEMYIDIICIAFPRT